MYIKFVLTLLSIVLLACFQLAFISGLPGFWSQFNLAVIALVFLSVLMRFKSVAVWALGLGIIFDLYSFSAFGLYPSCLLLTLAFIRFLRINFFTNKSLYSYLAVTILSILFYSLVLFVLSYLLGSLLKDNFAFEIGRQFWISKIYLFSAQAFFVVIIFYFLNILSNKLKPVFLFKKQY